jgi:predicted PurR-regulated permease PerM
VSLSIEQFLRTNRRPISWLALIGLLYVVRDLFALIFVTFLITIIAFPIVEYFQRQTRFPRFLIITVVYLIMAAGFVGAIWYAVPNVTREATTVANELPTYQDRLLKAWQSFLVQYKQLAPFEPMINSHARDLFDYARNAVGPILLGSARLAISTATTMAFAIMFSFLIMIDLRGLTSEIQRLGESRLKDFYEDTAEPVVQFFRVLARSFQAQAQVAILNTALVAIGFSFLGLPKMTLLLIIVFFFSFIPVLGVFISTTPAVIVAINAKGWEAGVMVVVIIAVIHALEAYVFNPLIYGNCLKLNPVITLLVLYVAHHFFGIWGAVLGVPVATYFLHYVFGVPEYNSPAGAKTLPSPPNQNPVLP